MRGICWTMGKLTALIGLCCTNFTWQSCTYASVLADMFFRVSCPQLRRKADRHMRLRSEFLSACKAYLIEGTTYLRAIFIHDEFARILLFFDAYVACAGNEQSGALGAEYKRARSLDDLNDEYEELLWSCAFYAHICVLRGAKAVPRAATETDALGFIDRSDAFFRQFARDIQASVYLTRWDQTEGCSSSPWSRRPWRHCLPAAASDSYARSPTQAHLGIPCAQKNIAPVPVSIAGLQIDAPKPLRADPCAVGIASRAVSKCLVFLGDLSRYAAELAPKGTSKVILSLFVEVAFLSDFCILLSTISHLP